MRSSLRRLLVMATADAVAVAMFWLLLRIDRPGWKTHEYPFIILYSVPLGALVLLFDRPIRRRLRSRRVLYVVAGIGTALTASIGWTFLAYVLTGGYLLASDVNPLWCWTVAALAATAVNLCTPDHMSPAAIVEVSKRNGG